MAQVLQCRSPSLSTMSLVLHIALFLTIFQTCNFCLSYASKPTGLGFSLGLIPRDSPKSPLYPGNLTQIERVERLVHFSKAREQYLKYSTSPTRSVSSNNGSLELPDIIQMGVFRAEFYYVVETVLGTPFDVQFLLMDTGGGLVWTQCMPCIRCYAQTNSLYNSRASSSYWKLPCSHFLCTGPNALYQCINNEYCAYSVSYGGGGGPTKGIASVETFRFALNDGTFQSLDGIVFGCSNDNVNFEFEGTPISGIMGLSWSPDSLVTQLANYVERRFSYCIKPYDEGGDAPTLLTFGSAIPRLVGNIQTTSFVVPPVRNYYFYLNLLDVSVGWEKLGFPPGTFRLNQDGTGGVFIDSGAIISFMNNQDLPNGRNPYKEVMGEFQKFYDSLRLVRKKENVPKGFELCYVMPEGFNHFATMTYHFDRADYTVDGKYVHLIGKQEGYFCVALAAGGGVSILGAWHQQNKRIVYDGNLMALQFVDANCN